MALNEQKWTYSRLILLHFIVSINGSVITVLNYV